MVLRRRQGAPPHACALSLAPPAQNTAASIVISLNVHAPRPEPCRLLTAPGGQAAVALHHAAGADCVARGAAGAQRAYHAAAAVRVSGAEGRVGRAVRHGERAARGHCYARDAGRALSGWAAKETTTWMDERRTKVAEPRSAARTDACQLRRGAAPRRTHTIARVACLLGHFRRVRYNEVCREESALAGAPSQRAAGTGTTAPRLPSLARIRCCYLGGPAAPAALHEWRREQQRAQ